MESKETWSVVKFKEKNAVIISFHGEIKLQRWFMSVNIYSGWTSYIAFHSFMQILLNICLVHLQYYYIILIL